MRTQVIDYQIGSQIFKGYLAYQDADDHKRPAVMVAHDWSGRSEFACKKAEDLAQLGYVGFAIDLYGNATVCSSIEDKQKYLMALLEERNTTLQQRLQVSLKTLQSIDVVDTHSIAGIGFCFGGLCLLDLARIGAGLRGIVSFHGILTQPEPALASKPIKTKILVLQGYDDPMVPPDQVQAFAQEMTAAKADWQIHMYGDTQHAFTQSKANDSKLGLIYNEVSSKRAWQSAQNFLAELFGK